MEVPQVQVQEETNKLRSVFTSLDIHWTKNENIKLNPIRFCDHYDRLFFVNQEIKNLFV